MQLIKIFFFIGIWLIISKPVLAQESDKKYKQIELEDTEVNFLFNYYSQDGDHAAVTGGIGTQKLNNIAPAVMANIPLDTNRILNIVFGVDAYSSASTDNIDYNLSSASSKDARAYISGRYTVSKKANNSSIALLGAISSEYDYFSLSTGLTYSKISKNENAEINISGQVFIDNWSLIYPIELRDRDNLLDISHRRSYNFSATYSQVINKKLQASISTDIVFQEGLLSTPFHRVYFTNQSVDIERLPNSRFKLPVGIRLNYYVNDWIIARMFYRHYEDNFGIAANTINVELPIKINPYFMVYPLYRYHSQGAADYFKPYAEHMASEMFYTSDYDLSAFTSHKIGFGLRYSPLYGISEFKVPFSWKKQKRGKLKSIDLRYANYNRSDGLYYNMISFDLAFVY